MDEWKREMNRWDVVLVTMMTWPLLLKCFIVDKICELKVKNINIFKNI
jgi:hypothetical protein